MELKFDLKELSDMVGGLYNAIDFINEIRKILEQCSVWKGHRVSIQNFNSGTKQLLEEDLIKYTINDQYAKLPGDSEAISGWKGSNYSYGYLRKTGWKLTIVFELDEEEILKINNSMGDVFKSYINKENEKNRKKEEMRIKYNDIDPYGEEDWGNENYIKKFKDFDYL